MTLFDNLCDIHYLTHGTKLREFKPISTLLIVCESHLSTLPYIFHILLVIIYREVLLCNLIDILTGDILGVRLKSFIVWVVEPRIPDSLFSCIATLY
jgi:hypothetical protein